MSELKKLFFSTGLAFSDSIQGQLLPFALNWLNETAGKVGRQFTVSIGGANA